MDVLIIPQDSKKILRVCLPNPKNGQPQHFIYDEDNLSLHEIIKHSDEFRSWFLGNTFCKEGHINFVTRIDPLFILLPLIIEAAEDKFHNFQDICTEFNLKSNGKFSRIDFALSPSLKWDRICDTREIDGETYVKFSESRTLDWLAKKHERTMKSLEDEFENSSRATLISYASDLICDYLPERIAGVFKQDLKRRYLK